MSEEEAPLAECYPVEDIYVDGLGRIETTGHNLRLVFFTRRPKEDGTVDREIVERIVLPSDGAIAAVSMLMMLPILGLQMMVAVGEALTQKPDVLR